MWPGFLQAQGSLVEAPSAEGRPLFSVRSRLPTRRLRCAHEAPRCRRAPGELPLPEQQHEAARRSAALPHVLAQQLGQPPGLVEVCQLGFDRLQHDIGCGRVASAAVPAVARLALALASRIEQLLDRLDCVVADCSRDLQQAGGRKNDGVWGRQQQRGVGVFTNDDVKVRTRFLTWLHRTQQSNITDMNTPSPESKQSLSVSRIRYHCLSPSRAPSLPSDTTPGIEPDVMRAPFSLSLSHE
eukprot:364283-Chlamydomonas_euryale.AAC.19